MDIRMEDDPSLLLIEESGVIVDSLRAWLTLAFPDVRLIETSNPDSKSESSQSESPDVVLMDISSLGKDGVERVRTMKATHPSAAILALVSLDHEAYRQAVVKAGAEACARVWRLRADLLPQLRKRLVPGSGDGQMSRPVRPDPS